MNRTKILIICVNCLCCRCMSTIWTSTSMNPYASNQVIVWVTFDSDWFLSSLYWFFTASPIENQGSRMSIHCWCHRWFALWLVVNIKNPTERSFNSFEKFLHRWRDVEPFEKKCWDDFKWYILGVAQILCCSCSSCTKNIAFV